MAIANTAHGGTATSAASATTLNVTVSAVAGETILISVCLLLGGTPTSITDNRSGGSNTYVQLGNTATNTIGTSLWQVRKIDSNVTTVTVNFATNTCAVAVST